jgi:hypothetical protein
METPGIFNIKTNKAQKPTESTKEQTNAVFIQTKPKRNLKKSQIG